MKDTQQEEDCDPFEDSDSAYANVGTPVKRKKKIVVASPRVSRQLKKKGSEDVTLTFSPQKSPRNLKQQLTQKSPLKHVPLTLENRVDPNHIPYYLLNFECILRGVIDETDDNELFDQSELEKIHLFRSLDLDARKLYVRLFQRKPAWILRGAISYDEIRDEDKELKVLAEKGFLLSGSSLNDLEAVLNLLTAPAVRQLCKGMNILAKGAQKKDFVQALLTHSKKKSFFTVSADKSLANVMLKKARELMASDCYLVENRGVFTRVLSLYSLSNFWEERDSDKGSQGAQQLTTILLQNTGRLIFPVFTIIRKSKIFRDRGDLLFFESACALESEVSEAFHDKDWNRALQPVQSAFAAFQKVLKNDDMTRHVQNLPEFLRKFTAGSVFAYVMTKGVELYERIKKHDVAVEFLRELLGQNYYLPDYHGHWRERLALDLDQHLKLPREAMTAIKDGLNDPYVQEARLLSLCQRAAKIAKAKKSCTTALEMRELEDHKRWLSPQDPVNVTIQGKQMPKTNAPGEKTVFVIEGKTDGENDFLCSVEEFVRDHYKSERGFTNGIHGEGSVVNTITAILFWDIIYDLEVPDAFRSPQQACPLDYDSPAFYVSRKAQIEERLESLSKWKNVDLCEFASQRWELSSHITSSLANWELFSSLGHFLGLLKCITGPQLSGLCRRLVTNHRHTRSGFPDLTMWDTTKNRVAFVEVKGPNDRLSNKQILWLDYLTSLGFEAVTCHIEAVNAKRLAIASPKKKSAKKRARNSSGDDFA